MPKKHSILHGGHGKCASERPFDMRTTLFLNYVYLQPEFDQKLVNIVLTKMLESVSHIT